jgi:hypothetical protein
MTNDGGVGSTDLLGYLENVIIKRIQRQVSVLWNVNGFRRIVYG